MVRLQKTLETPPLWGRLSQRWARFFMPGDMIAFVVLAGLLALPPLSLQAAEWPISMDVVLPITILSVFIGLILARSQFNEFMSLIISSIYGMGLVLLLTALTLDKGSGGVYDVFQRSITWLVDALTGGINQDDLVFTLLVASLFWFLGYNAAWHLFRIDRIWRVVLPPGIILATNAAFYDGDVDLNGHMIVFVFLALMLVARSNHNQRRRQWQASGLNPSRTLNGQFLRLGAFLALVPLLLGVTLPSNDLEERLARFREFLQSDPMVQMSEVWNRLFSPIEAAGPTTSDYYGGNSLDLGGAIRLGDQDVLFIEAPPEHRYYWRSRVFDTYESGRWTPAATTRLTDSTAPLNISTSAEAARVSVLQEFTIALNATRILYAAPQPLSIDLPTRSDLSYTAPEGAPDRTMNVSVIRPLSVIRRGESYRATSQVSVASAIQLRAASVDYPEWVRQVYLYVSPSITSRTKDLARQIVQDAEAVTVYDQAKAIERWLRLNITYNESIPGSPAGQDPVDWVLFDQREGYCNYYASAMIMMLRSLGIPARLAAGFAQGEFDASQGQYVVTERDAHTWVEVYFPGYGWIEFEPTASQLPIDREGDDEQGPPPQIAQVQPSSTPTATPSPLPTETPEVTPTSTPPPDDASVPPVAPTATPTITPTFTPSPTATPVIVPTQPAPMTPESGDALDLVLPALGALFLIILAVVLLFAVGMFIWWWWEWRGMRGFSPITRAYARLERYMALIGLQLPGQDTPEERRRRIVTKLPRARQSVTAITRLYMTERYGPGDSHPAQAHQNAQISDQAWSEARKNILQRWSRRFKPWIRNKDAD